MQAELPGTDLARPVHPVAQMFPMMSDEELDDLASDIRENGLVHPIVIDGEGMLIDGRNRLEACRRAKVEPEWTVFDGDDPVAFILSSNVNRRHLSKGQQAMAVARARVFATNTSQAQAAKQAGLDRTRVVYASVVLEYAPEYADRVLAGTFKKTISNREQAHEALHRETTPEERAEIEAAVARWARGDRTGTTPIEQLAEEHRLPAPGEESKR